MDTNTSQGESSFKTAWEILGVKRGASWLEIRSAFLKKARRLHPDKGGDRKEFQELRTAYESLKRIMDENDEDTSSQEVWDEIEKWVDWAGRWGKRILGDDIKVKPSTPEILRIRIPWKLLEDRTQSVKVEYDGWPIRVPLSITETIGSAGLRIRLLPQAEYIEMDCSGNEHIRNIEDDPWTKSTNWLYDVPSCAHSFRICGGDWKTEPGIYGRGVHWRRV